MHKNATKCNKTQSKWCINKYGASKVIDTFETYQGPSQREAGIKHVLEIFICKIEVKVVLRGGCFYQRLATEFLLSSILKK
jgi:hypothetical protein